MSLTPTDGRTLGSAAPVWNIPFNRNPAFTGREALLSTMHKVLTQGDTASRILALDGLGGVGKTQLCVEYAYRHRTEYGIIWWVRAEEPTTTATDYARLAARLGMQIPEEATLEAVRDMLFHLLESRSDWLLIFDNVRNAEELRPSLPQFYNGQIIITSRNPNWRGVAKSMHVPVMEPAEAVSFLRKRTRRNDPDEAAGKLAQALGYLPLALEQAGALIDQARLSFSDYLSRFETHWAELLRMGRRTGDYPNTVAMTWELSFREVESTTPGAADLLYLCAFLSPEGIERDLLASMEEFLPYPLRVIIASPLKFDEAIAALLQYSLCDVKDKYISIHRLVAAVTRDRLREEDRRRWCEITLRIVHKAFDFQKFDIRTWARCAAVLPHALAAVRYAEALDVAPKIVARVLNDMGRYMVQRAMFEEARGILERALAISKRTYSEKHMKISAVANNLGIVLKRLNRPAEAREHFELALSIDQGLYGHDHPHVATIVNNYGMCLEATGDVQMARQQFEWALQVFERHFGNNHAAVATIVNNLGYVLNELGEPAPAKAHLERALTIAQATCGAQHPTVAAIYHNMGNVHRSLGDPQSARGFYLRALAIDEAAYGQTHPDVARDLVFLADLLRDLGEIPESRQVFDRSLTVMRNLYGDSHKNTEFMRRHLQRFDNGIYEPLDLSAVRRMTNATAPLAPTA